MTAASRKVSEADEAGDAEIETPLTAYTGDLAAKVADRAARFTRAAANLPAGLRWQRALTSTKSLERLLTDLPDDGIKAMALFRRAPATLWRWDHAVRLLSACSIEFPYAVLQGLLGDGLLFMVSAVRHAAGDLLPRFDVADGAPPEALPSVGLAPPLESRPLSDFPSPLQPLEGRTEMSGWRRADGWDIPLRLSVLWRLAWRTPIKRTQQQQLFKRDQERIAGGTLLNAPPVDAPTPLVDVGLFTYAVAMQQGWLDPAADEQSPGKTLANLWPESLISLQLEIARAVLGLDGWNELGPAAPVGAFARESPSARFLLLLHLATLSDGAGVAIDQLAERLIPMHPPWNAKGEVFGPFRQKETRNKLAREWVRATILGALYQTGVIEIAVVANRETLVRLSPLGRRLLGEPIELEEPPHFQTLLAQPNHQIIVYRQGLTVPLLAKLVLIAEPTGLGPALTFELKAESVYLGLEAGMSDQEMLEVLERYGGRETPFGLAESIRTWAQKRDRITVYSTASLFEFDSREDMDAALARGLAGAPLTDRLLLLPGEPSFGNLRIAAQRDYLRSPVEPCVTPAEDGVSLRVDLSRSDLMLESELGRFAEPAPGENRQLFLLTPASLRQAFEQGLSSDVLLDWFERRTGSPAPPSVVLLARMVEGKPIEGSKLLVVEVDDPIFADGLLQHPTTAKFFVSRLGPTALAARLDQLEELTAALNELGAPLQIRE